MTTWKLKSESDIDQVFAEMKGDKETGYYRYVIDGVTTQVGPMGLKGRSRKAAHPRRKWAIAAAVVPSALLAADVAWRVFG